ncbi:MAG: hypothetical protein U5L11_10340 [Arhodomonas sp.]|nr:hypothetical protein [Arhodomonas sp.]
MDRQGEVEDLDRIEAEVTSVIEDVRRCGGGLETHASDPGGGHPGARAPAAGH